MKTSLKNYDNAYGIKPIEESIDFKLGNEIVKIDGNNITINNKQYIGNGGLWKLPTWKNLGEVSKNDYDSYEKIMIQTKAFLKEDETVKSNRCEKYVKFIKPIYDKYKFIDEIKETTSELRQRVRAPRRSSTGDISRGNEISGTGFKFLPSDPDELVNRHRILFSEIQSGNNKVLYELQAINDELLRLDYLVKI